MSVFRDLMARAAARGPTHLRFAVDLEAASKETSTAWACEVADAAPGEDAAAFGRTGEEALRNLVAKLESP